MKNQPNELSKLIQDEIIKATGLPPNNFTHSLFWPFLHKLTDHLADLLDHFDDLVGDKGLPEASQWLYMNFCNPARMFRNENLPKEGPLLVVTNHPGAYDALVVFSELNRQDIKWISNDIPAFHLCKNVQKHILYSSNTHPEGRFLVLRNAIQHLQSGGALVYIASGGRDPDPAVYSGADYAIDHWLDTFDTFNKYVHDLRILPTMVSHVISPKWVNHPVTWLRRDERWKQILSEFGQVLYQLSHPGRLMINPAISFGASLSEAEIRKQSGDGNLRTAIIEREQILLKEHLTRFNGSLRD